MGAKNIAGSVDVDLEVIRKQAMEAAEELLAEAKLKPGQILVVGCSSSEVAAHVVCARTRLKYIGGERAAYQA